MTENFGVIIIGNKKLNNPNLTDISILNTLKFGYFTKFNIITARDANPLETPTISAALKGLLSSFCGTNNSEPGSIAG